MGERVGDSLVQVQELRDATREGSCCCSENYGSPSTKLIDEMCKSKRLSDTIASEQGGKSDGVRQGNVTM